MRYNGININKETDAFMKGFQAFVGKMVHKIFPKSLAKWYDKYQSALWYLFFGVVTTAVNFACYAVLKYTFFKETFASNEATAALICNWIAWAAAVLAAFFMNRSYVFDSHEKGKTLLMQFALFVSMRFASGIVENVTPSALISFLNMGDMWAKGIVAIVVVILNYFFSKFVAFRKSKENTDDQAR